MTLKVLHVYRTYFPDSQGGLEEVIRQICLNTGSHGVESCVFSLSINPEPAVMKREESILYRFHRTFEVASCGVSLSSFSGFKALTKLADIIHYHFPWPFADMLHLACGVKKPSVITYHSDIVRQKFLLHLYRPLMRRFLNSVNVIVPTSHNYFVTSEELERYAEKVKVIPIGLDNDSYPEVSEDLLRICRECHGEGFFLFIGVLRYYKGLHILLDAIKGTSIRCLIAGSGPVENELKERAVSLGLRNVHFAGHVSDDEKVALLTLCRAVVFPSHLRSEAFGVTLLEGAMYSKPLISTEIGTGTSYINQHGETGFVVTPSDPVSLRQAILKFQNNPELAQQMGRAARNRYEQEFTGELMGKRYAQLYKNILEQQ